LTWTYSDDSYYDSLSFGFFCIFWGCFCVWIFFGCTIYSSDYSLYYDEAGLIGTFATVLGCVFFKSIDDFFIGLV
jgi:hypothetical protein